MDTFEKLSDYVANGIEDMLDNYEDRGMILIESNCFRSYTVEIKGEIFHVTVEKDSK